MAYSLSPERYNLRDKTTSSYSIGKILYVLSKYKETSQNDCDFRFSVPLKITSCMLDPRKAFALCSPSTQRIASATLLFPQPFGPTIPVTPDSNFISSLSANDLKPYTSIFLNFSTIFLLLHFLYVLQCLLGG